MFTLTCCSNVGNNFWSLMGALFGYQVRLAAAPHLPLVQPLGPCLLAFARFLSYVGCSLLCSMGCDPCQWLEPFKPR